MKFLVRHTTEHHDTNLLYSYFIHEGWNEKETKQTFSLRINCISKSDLCCRGLRPPNNEEPLLPRSSKCVLCTATCKLEAAISGFYVLRGFLTNPDQTKKPWHKIIIAPFTVWFFLIAINERRAHRSCLTL